MSVAHDPISVYGSLKGSQSGGGGGGKRPHPFLVASKTSLSPFCTVHPPPFGSPNNNKVDQRQRKIGAIGCTTIDPNMQGAPLQNWGCGKNEFVRGTKTN